MIQMVDNEERAPVCPMCGDSLIVDITPGGQFFAPMHINMTGRCNTCDENIAIVYTFDERMGIENEKRTEH